MKECPNCGAQARDEWVRCPSCRANMLEAAVRLGRDRYVAPGETAPSGPPDLAAYELPRRSPVVTAAAPVPMAAAPGALWVGGATLLVSLSCPAIARPGAAVAFTSTTPGALLVLAGLVLVGALWLRRPRVAGIAVAASAVIAVVTGALLLAALGGYPQLGGVGWGWGVLLLGLGLSIHGARAWSAAAG